MHSYTLRPKPASRALVRIVLVALLAGVGWAAGWSAPAAAADGDVSWAVRTASNSFGSERQNYSYSLDPGGRLEDGLVVANHGGEALTLAVYAADGYTTAAGQIDLDTRETTSTALGAWVRPGRESVMIEPGASAEIPFLLAVPANATPGDYLGGIVTSLMRADDAEQINVDRRLAISIRLRVGGELAPSLAIEDLGIHYSGTANPFSSGDATVDYTLRNTGNVVVSASQEVSVSGPFGVFAVHSDRIGDTPQLLPGDTWQVSVPVTAAPTLRLTAEVTVTPLATDLSGTIAPLAVVEASASTWAVPWTLLLIAVLLLGVVAAAVLARRRRRRIEKAAQDARVEAAVQEALREREASER